LYDFYIAFLQMTQAPADIPGLAFTKHDEKKRRHENMVRPAIDKNNVVVGAKFPAQMGGSDHASTTAAENYDPFFSVQ
jgi:hypothetical protein